MATCTDGGLKAYSQVKMVAMVLCAARAFVACRRPLTFVFVRCSSAFGSPSLSVFVTSASGDTFSRCGALAAWPSVSRVAVEGRLTRVDAEVEGRDSESCVPPVPGRGDRAVPVRCDKAVPGRWDEAVSGRCVE
mmetsp:Transcript_58719/g.130844  ORF Transcript_58719/g.130844 Transcript_58719/m.130844 type:complete len:134 (+) Transcript_58719:349-750(+)